MDSASEKQHLEDISAYVFVERKIVTYKWLSNVFGLHINTAKQLLHTFFEGISEERKSELQVTYLLGGTLNKGQGYRFLVVKNGNLEKVKCHFKVVTSEHIYSLCVASQLPDLCKLCAVDNSEEDTAKHAAVRCKKCVLRDAEVDALKRQETLVKPDESKHWTTNTNKEKPTQSSKKEKPSISSMFTAQAKPKPSEPTNAKEKEEVPAVKKEPEPAAKKPSKGSKPPGGRLAAMFSAQSAKPKPKKEVVDTPDERKNSQETESTENDEDMKTTPETESAEDTVSEKKKETKGASKKSTQLTNNITKKEGNKKSKQKKRNVSRNSQESAKKRKRIVVAEDSDSSDNDIFGRDESPERSPSPPPQLEEEGGEEEKQSEEMEITEVTPKTENPPGDGHKHSRKRQLVDRTFMDEEGFIVTKKEYVLEICSDSEKEDEKENVKGNESRVIEAKDAAEKEEEEESNEKKSKGKGGERKSRKIKKEEEEESNEKKSKGKGGERKSNDAPEKKKGKTSNASKKKASPPDKKKQAMLTSFFKKS